MRKKVLTLVCGLMLVLSLAACGSSEEAEEPETAAQEEEEAAAETETGEEEEEEETVTETSDVVFEEVTVVDDDNLTIVVESFDTDRNSFNLLLENKTDDVTLMFAADDVSVNGVMCDPLFATEVSPGMKSYADVTFYSLEDAGINYIESVDMSFRVYDSDDWTADNYFEGTATLTVENTSTEEATYRRSSENGFTEVVIAENDNVRVTVIDYDEGALFGPAFTLYIENFSDKNVMVSADDVAVNGVMCDPFWATSVSAGKNSYSDMDWSDSTLEENHIDEIESVQFTLRVYDGDDWSADDLFKDTVEFAVN